MLWMLEEPPADGMDDEGPKDFFGVELSTRPEHTMHLRYSPPPLWNMMDGTEIDNRIVHVVPHGYRARVTHPQSNPRTIPGEPPSGEADHPGIEIERVDGIGAEELEDELGADTATAADFQGPPAADRATHSKQTTRLDVPLEGRPHRVVHEGLFETVKQHCNVPSDHQRAVNPELTRSQCPIS